MKEWNFYPLFDLQSAVHRPVFAPDLSKPCPTSNHVQTTYLVTFACQDYFFVNQVTWVGDGLNKTSRSEQGLPSFLPCANYLYIGLSRPISLSIKSNG